MFVLTYYTAGICKAGTSFSTGMSHIVFNRTKDNSFKSLFKMIRESFKSHVLENIEQGNPCVNTSNLYLKVLVFDEESQFKSSGSYIIPLTKILKWHN